MLLTKFVPNFDAKLEPNLMQICIKFIQIKFQKSSGTKMHTSLVGI